MKVFVTGATGFIGQPLARDFLDRGWDVVALVRNPESAEARTIQSFGARLVQGDITDRESMRAAMDNMDVVVHNAAWYEMGITKKAWAKMHAINVEGTDNTLGLAVELKIPKIIYTSSVVALGSTGKTVADESFQPRTFPLSYYMRTKREAHDIALDLQQLNAPLVIACPSNVIGVGDHSPWGYFARMYVRGFMPPIGWMPNTIYSCVHVDDVAEAMALIVEKGQSGQTYLLAGEAKTMREIIGIWNKTPGGLKSKLWLPRSLAMLAGAMSEPVQRIMGLPVFLSCETVAMSCVDYHFSGAKAQRELGVKFRCAEQLWGETLDAERKRAKKR